MREHALPWLVLTTFLLPAALAAQERRPLNVLFIISDDLRTELTCYGGKANTPNLDALAASGVRFDRAYCQYPLCNPSRTSMLTGRYPVTTRVIGNRDDFRQRHPDWISLPQLFRENGYVAMRAGKIYHGAGLDDPKAWSDVALTQRAGTLEPDAPPATAPATGNRAGMTRAQYSDRIVVLEGDGETHGDYRAADRTIAALRQFKDRPFFIACGFVKPHSPPTAPQRYFDLYPIEQIELPPDFAPRPTVWDGFPKRSIRPRNADLFIGREATPDAAKEMIRAYLASTSWMDFNVGRVLAEVDALGLGTYTVIVFWGDHGYQLGEKGKWSKAGSVWEKGTRVPLFLVAPGAAGKGKVSPRVVESIDLFPTLAELCGLEPPEGLEGRSLVPLLEDPQREWDHPAYSVWSEDGHTLTHVAVRNERFRYAQFDGGAGGEMLIDLENDRDELNNIAGDPQHAKMKAQLAKLAKEHSAKFSD